jgi:LPXTG-site transpeptidase (sortase) family protein
MIAEINYLHMKTATSFNELYRQIRLRKGAFFVMFFVAVLLAYTVLFIIDFIPEPIKEVPVDESAIQAQVAEVAEEEQDVEVTQEVVPVVDSPLPLKIIFDTLDKEITVLNPESREVAALDTALLDGAVRHPDSADFADDGNIFILAHSSYLPNVFNKNFQAFNGIQDLTWGDTVRLQSEDMEYVYRVDKVYKAKASELFVPETPGEAKLTLATCNSFGSKDDRFMVEATLVGSYKI